MFKVGDKVKRITFGNLRIKAGGIYTVKSVNGNSICLEEDPFVFYLSTTFVLHPITEVEIDKAKAMLEKHGYVVTEKPKPKKKTFYINFYRFTKIDRKIGKSFISNSDVGNFYNSRKEADEACSTRFHRIACKKVTITEGEYDE